MGNLVPKNWVETDLDKIFNLKYGKGLPVKSLTETGYDVYGANGIIGSYSKFQFNQSRVIISCRGAASGAIHLTNPQSFVTSNSIVLDEIKFGLFNQNYLFYIMRAVDKSSVITGTAQPQITIQLLKDLKIPLPPRAEQDRIVAKVDALMAQHAAIQQAMERIPQLLKNFRQQVLTQAVTGKLTKEWRVGKELGELLQLLESIDERRKKHKSKKVREINREVRTDLDLYVIPPNWKWLRLEYLMDEEEKFRYGVVQPGNNVDEQKLIRVKDIINEEVDFDSLRGISWKINDKYKSAQVKEGNILVSIVGTIGRTIIIDNKSAGFSIARALAKIPIKDFSSKYIKLFLDSSIGQTWLVGDTREVARKTLNLEQLKTLPVPVPPLQEQDEIVRRVESLFEKATAIAQRYEQLKFQIDTLPQSILHKAFKGELVEQLESDGSAMELLREIEGLKLDSKKKN